LGVELDGYPVFVFGFTKAEELLAPGYPFP